MQYWNETLSVSFCLKLFTLQSQNKMQNLEEVHSLIYKSIFRTKQEQTEFAEQ